MNVARRGIFRSIAGAAAVGTMAKALPSATTAGFNPPRPPEPYQEPWYGGDEIAKSEIVSRVMTAAQKLAKKSARDAGRAARNASRRLGRLRSMSDAAKDYYLAVAEDEANTLERKFSKIMGWTDFDDEDNAT